MDPLTAQVFATACEVIGGSLCFALSSVLGRPLLNRFAPSFLSRFQAQTETRRKKGDLWYFALFLRMTPLIPNWLVNMAAQPAGIPYHVFLTTMLIGLQVATFLSIRVGVMLFSLAGDTMKGDDLLNMQAIQNFLIMLVAQFIALIPVYFLPKNDDFAKEWKETASKQTDDKDE